MIKNNLVLLFLYIFSFIAVTTVESQEVVYQANWESLNSRPVAEWFSDAKFGVFIHWGLYSVPSWSPNGTYTEWYQTWFQSQSVFGNGTFTGQEIPEFHYKTYGKDFNYIDFTKLWKAELYNPEQWATLFKKAGAKYVVMTSKHHDGYTLWPNEHASKSRGYLWNSVSSGPHRDLVGDYVKAMKDAGLKAGLYFSLYEWYHPWYQLGLDKFVSDYLHPQFKELVDQYAPDLIYADGEWNNGGEYWKSTDLLSWLFNESKVKSTVVINDRWEAGGRHKNGGFYTTEYLREEINFDKPWEEIRGMGLSFGYNRAENIENYNSAQALVLMLIDIVSQGGNLCINVGPKADGRIPVIMQERLLQMGKWLETNGEAIYGTKEWKRSFQWTEGDRNFQLLKEGQSYVEGTYILDQTVNQLPGKALKELFFTSKDNSVYAISPKWPHNELIIKDIEVDENATVEFLATGEKLSYSQQGSHLVIRMPDFNPNDLNLEDQLAYVFKISQVK